MFKLDQKHHFISKSKIVNYFTFSFFCLYFFIGFTIFKDYGITTDEPFQRSSGYYWYIWILENFLNDSSNLNSLKDKFSKMEWSQHMLSGTFLEYGVIFDLLNVFLENLFDIKNSQNIYFLKHFLNFLIFYTSSICFFYIIKHRFKNNFIGLIGVIFYITSPRIFAESFYNSKDIIFMSFSVFAIFFAMRLLKNYKTKNIILFSLFSALATDIRTMGIFFIFLFFIFFIIESLETKNFFKEKLKFIFLLLILYFLFVFIFWPYLWSDPLNNFALSFKSFKNYGWGGSILYLGNFINAQYLPWHYSLVWIFISNPIIYSVLLIIGSLKIFHIFSNNFLKISEKNPNQKLWLNSNEKVDLFLLLFFVGPLIAVVFFGSTLYNGWRHLYFIYPSLIYIAIFALNYILKITINKLYKNFLYIGIFLAILFNIFNLISLHPFQNIYFNSLFEKKANALFEVDYWGSGNSYSINKILEDIDEAQKVSLRTASFTPLSYSKYIINNSKIKNINFTGSDDLNQEYIFTNYVYEENPIFLKKYFIPDNYKKIFTLKRGNIIINEIYKKK